MACTDCHRASIGPGWPMHCPTCLWCGARYIRRIGATLALPIDERSRMRTKALADWLAHGHSEIEIRRLVAGLEVPLAPIGLDEPKESDPPKSVKRH